MAQARQKEEELLAQLSSLESRNQELEASQTAAAAALRQRLRAAMFEIEDLKREHEYEKETLLDSVREQQRELGFLEEVLANVLSAEELAKIRSHSVWSEASGKLKLPPFLFREKTVRFPHLSFAQSQGLNAQQRQLRELELGCGLISEEGSGDSEAESPWGSEKNYEAKQGASLAAKRNTGLKLNVKPVVKEEEEEEKKKERKAFPRLFGRPGRSCCRGRCWARRRTRYRRRSSGRRTSCAASTQVPRPRLDPS